MLKKILGIFLIAFGVMGLLTLLVDFTIIGLLSGIILIALGYNLFKNKKSVPMHNNRTTSYSPTSETKPSTGRSFSFNVVGISKKNDQGDNIQKLIREFVKDQIEFSGEDVYEGMSNKEILEDGVDVFEVDLGDYGDIELIPEPDNPYDPNAIKVIHEDIGHIGYVPKESTQKVKSVLDKDYEVEWKLVGGKKKYVDYDEDKVKTETLHYGMVIDISH